MSVFKRGFERHWLRETITPHSIKAGKVIHSIMTTLFSYFRHRYDKIRGDQIHAHPKESEIRQKLKKELYEYSQNLFHGFPSKPSALAYDPKLKLLALATKSGTLRVYGAPGVEFYGQHESGETVTQLVFIPEEARLVSLTSDNVLHLWEINSENFKSKLEEKKTFEDFSSDGSKAKTISAVCLFGHKLLLGTEGGNIHIMNLSTFTLSDEIIYQDVIMRNVPDDFKVNPGAVEAMAKHPTDVTKFLIGYNRGLIVLWDTRENKADLTFNATQQLEALTWHRNGEEFMSAHADGSYILWSLEDSSKPKEQATTPYGPFPCKAITKLDWKTCDGEEEPFIIFSGGMARGSYGDKYTVSVIQGETHVTFDFTSRVIDFYTVCTGDETDFTEEGHDAPHTLFVLLEEEVVAIDLSTPEWPPHRLPYLNSLHSSAITAYSHVNNVPESLWKKITEAGDAQFQSYSQKRWPVSGGEVQEETIRSNHLLLTGHEDGSVKFWDASGVAMNLLYKVSTAAYFEEGFNDMDLAEGIRDPTSEDDDEWPPFRKVGHFDPYTDDPRLGVQRMFLCPVSDILVVAGTAGQVIVMQMEREERDQEIRLSKVNLVSDRDNFVWKGHDGLTVVQGDVRYKAGFQPQTVLQVTPPAACTALAVHSEWQLFSIGTAHGFCLFDFRQKRTISATCTLSASETSATDDSSMSRRKSFKKSLRESFRRLRRRRSMNNKSTKRDPNSTAANRLQEINAAEKSGPGPRVGPGGRRLAPPTSIEEDLPPAERAIEARVQDINAQPSMVKCLHFADTYLNVNTHSPSLLAGTNAGKVYMFAIVLPANDKRDQEDVTARIAKEVTLKHQAPVVALSVVDSTYYPLPPALEVQNGRAKAPDMSANHKLLVVSEEQFKLFALPTLKPEDKWKLTAHEGRRTRKVGTCTFRSRSDEQYTEMDIACVSNLGDLSVYTIKGLRRQINVEAMCKTDINAIASCIFTSSGEGFFLVSSSEYAKFSLSAAKIMCPACKLNLKTGMRTPDGIPQVIVENYDENTETRRDSAALSPDTTVNQSMRSVDMTQDEVRDYVTEETDENQGNITPTRGDNAGTETQAQTVTEVQVQVQITPATPEPQQEANAASADRSPDTIELKIVENDDA